MEPLAKVGRSNILKARESLALSWAPKPKINFDSALFFLDFVAPEQDGIKPQRPERRHSIGLRRRNLKPAQAGALDKLPYQSGGLGLFQELAHIGQTPRVALWNERRKRT